MTFAVGDRVLTARPASTVALGPFGYPFGAFVFGTVSAIGAGNATVQWDNGKVSATVPEAALDYVTSEEIDEPFCVRIENEASPQYTGMVLGIYPRILGGSDGTTKGIFWLVRLFQSSVLIEGLATDFVRVESR